jgi:hypothetical protein
MAIEFLSNNLLVNAITGLFQTLSQLLRDRGEVEVRENELRTHRRRRQLDRLPNNDELFPKLDDVLESEIVSFVGFLCLFHLNAVSLCT